MKGMKEKIFLKIEIPEGVEMNIDEMVIARGEKGVVEEKIDFGKLRVKKHDESIIIEAEKATRREKKLAGTIKARLLNMIRGVTKGFCYKLQICSSHFPISVSFDESRHTLLIKNFLGERIQRKAAILPDVRVRIEGNIISVEGVRKESVAQSAANIEAATKKKGKGLDKRVVMDGIYLIEKNGKKIVF